MITTRPVSTMRTLIILAQPRVAGAVGQFARGGYATDLGRRKDGREKPVRRRPGQAGEMVSRPRYARSTSGTSIEPSGRW